MFFHESMVACDRFFNIFMTDTSSETASTSGSSGTSSQENHKPGVNTTFTKIWKQAWEFYKPNYLLLAIVFLPSLVAELLLQAYTVPTFFRVVFQYFRENQQIFLKGDPKPPSAEILQSLALAGAVILIGAVLIALWKFIAMGSGYQLLNRGADSTLTVARAVRNTLKNLGKSVFLAIRILLYIAAWQIPFLIVSVVFILFAMGAAGQVLPFEEGGVAKLIFILLGVLSLLVSFYLKIRATLKVRLAYPLFFMSPNPDSAKAFRSSMQVTRKYLWRIYLNMFIFGLVLGLGFWIYSSTINVIKFSHPGLNPIMVELQEINEELKDNYEAEVVVSPDEKDEEAFYSGSEKITSLAREILKSPEKQNAIRDSFWVTILLRTLLLIPGTLFVYGFFVAFYYALTRKIIEEKKLNTEELL